MQLNFPFGDLRLGLAVKQDSWVIRAQRFIYIAYLSSEGACEWRHKKCNTIHGQKRAVSCRILSRFVSYIPDCWPVFTSTISWSFRLAVLTSVPVSKEEAAGAVESRYRPCRGSKELQSKPQKYMCPLEDLLSKNRVMSSRGLKWGVGKGLKCVNACVWWQGCS